MNSVALANTPSAVADGASSTNPHVQELYRVIAMSEFSPLSISGAWQCQAPQPGKAVTVLAGIHGNEPSGVYAISRLVGELIQGSVKLKSGTLCIALGNEEALAADKRFMEINLNRLFGRTAEREGKTGYEYERVVQLEELISQADVLLDMHSSSRKSPPFCFSLSTRLELGKEIGFPHLVSSTPEFFGPIIKGTTLSFVEQLGIPAFVLESGQHKEDITFQQAYEYLCKFLYHQGIIEKTPLCDITAAPMAYMMCQCEHLRDYSFKYSRDFGTLDRLAPGEIIGEYKDLVLRSEGERVIILPTDPAIMPLGEELFYLASIL